MESFISTFHIDLKIIIAQTVNFIIIFLVLYFFALKPLKKIMNERTSIIEKGISDAKNNAEIIISTRKKYEEIIAQARIEAHQLFQEGKKESEAKKNEIIEEAQSEVLLMIANGKKNLETEKTKMIEEAKVEIVSLVVAATEKILKDQTNYSITDKAVKNINNI